MRKLLEKILDWLGWKVKRLKHRPAEWVRRIGWNGISAYINSNGNYKDNKRYGKNA